MVANLVWRLSRGAARICGGAWFVDESSKMRERPGAGPIPAIGAIDRQSQRTHRRAISIVSCVGEPLKCAPFMA
ncbi:MAG TPA: hypothetical protein VJ023_10635 [Pyrinomonadaceae bacterium]|nr:hypothetical protein [Pyrinomonadaceae bacterium]